MRTTLSTKGHIVLPKSLRDQQRIGPGTMFEIEAVGNLIVLRPLATSAASCEWSDLIGFNRPDGPTRSIAEQDAAVFDRFRSRGGRG